MTIVLIKLKWVHYNLNTRLCLNCILMSPNWLRWMLSLVVSDGWDSLLCDRLVTRPLMDAALDQMRLGENKCRHLEIQLSHWWVSLSLSNACVPSLWCDNIGDQETDGGWVWSGLVTELSTPHLLLARPGSNPECRGDNNCLEWNDHDDESVAQLEII